MGIIDFFVKRDNLIIDTVVAYRNMIGVVDLRALEKFINKYNVSMLFLISTKELTTGSLKYLNTFGNKVKIDTIISEHISNDIKKIKKKSGIGIVKVIDLDEFGERPMQRDSC